MDIVLASDFSEPAERAVDATISLARGLGDRVLALHAVEPYDTPSDPAALRERAAADQLEGLVARLRRDGIDARARVAKGIAEEVIAEVAQSLAARLIVVGTHGRRAPARWLLGSVAERVVARADRPVLVVRDGTDALRSWSRSERPLRLAIALESRRLDASLSALVLALRQVAPCDVTLVHVLGSRAPHTRVQQVIECDFRADLAQLGGQGPTAVRILAGGAPITERLQTYLQHDPRDVVVVGVHRGTGIHGLRSGHVARGLLHAGIGAVLSVPLASEQQATNEVLPFRDILVGVDWSELSVRTIAHAFGLLLGRGGRINLVHIQCTPALEPVPDDVRKALEQRLAELVPPEAAASDIETNFLVLPGESVADAILSAAVRLGSDVICVGSHGPSIMGRMILGSVALEIAHGSHLPVLLVR